MYMKSIRHNKQCSSSVLRRCRIRRRAETTGSLAVPFVFTIPEMFVMHTDLRVAGYVWEDVWRLDRDISATTS